LGGSGARVSIWGRSAARNLVALQTLSADQTEATSQVCDVSIEESVDAAMAATLERFGRVDAVFANAGIDGMQPFVEMTMTEWRRVLGVNLDGVFLTFRAAVRHMLARGGGGSLVATSSVAALGGRPAREHYVASKAGVLGLVRCLALELGPHNIRANSIVPGPIETEMARLSPDREVINQRVKGKVPLGRRGSPDELGGIAVYLASDASSYHTGDTIIVDGGLAIAP
jgi:NAD(P)-dependent dehydrogenase (short-subunit alcohol dehydrogenase family)